MKILLNERNPLNSHAVARTASRIVVSLAFLFDAGLSFAACPSQDEVAKFVEDFSALRPNSTFTPAISSVADAECAQDMVINQLKTSLGPVIGYKAMLSHDRIRKYLGFQEPFWGAMFGKYVVNSPAKVSANHGAVPIWELDMLVEVKSPKLAEAKTSLEALQYLSAFIPFVELPDGVNPGQKPRTEHFLATNGGFRHGVVGKKIVVEPTEQFLQTLADMDVVATDNASGETIVAMKGNALMEGNPINVAVWLAKALKKRGIELKAGDLLSLGGSIPQRPKPGTAITVKYIGLPGTPAVQVQFE